MGTFKGLVRQYSPNISLLCALLKNIHLVGNMFLIIYCALYSVEDAWEQESLLLKDVIGKRRQIQKYNFKICTIKNYIIDNLSQENSDW